MAADAIDKLDPRELGQNLKLAREQRGFRQEDAARIINVARTTLTAIEQGKRRIKPDELISLVQAYGRSISDFIRPRPMARDFQVQFRGPSSSVKIESEKIVISQVEFQELCRNYLELEIIMGAPLNRNYPVQYRIEGLGAAQAAEGVAIQERNRLGLGDGPLPILRTILEQEVGLRVFYIPFKDSHFSEMYYYDDELGGCLAVNQNHPEERRRWSLAHGYAHFLVHRFKSAIFYESFYEREQFADFFAKFFLMPTSGLTRNYHKLLQSKSKPTIGDLCVLANYYGVSLSALVRRLENLGVAPNGTWERMRERGIKVKDAQEQLGLSPIPEQSSMLPLRYQYLAVEAFEKGEISEGLFATLLRVNRLNARAVTQKLSSHTSDVTHDQLIDISIDQSMQS